MLYEIKSWVNGEVLFSAECGSLKACVELAVSQCVSLNGAELNYAELNGAELSGAELSGAKLNYAKLNGADLSYAKLNYAELSGAELTYAKLTGAELIRIDGLKYSVIISPTHIHVACKRFTWTEFRDLNLSEIRESRNCAEQYPLVIAMMDALEKMRSR